MTSGPQPPLTVRLASPRGFCAGVERAIRTVEETLAAYGAPVYVRHEIVHNKHVVKRLAAMGAVFVDDLADVPTGPPVILSAHGAPASVHAQAKSRSAPVIDATCPLVHKVHAEARRHAALGRHIYLIGHQGHPEVVGALGQIEPGAATLVETANDIALLPNRPGGKAYLTQTTLSLDDAATAIAALKKRFPDIVGPNRQDICYATTNRQEAVKATAANTDLYIVFGSPSSSNSLRLVETARRAGAREAMLAEDADHVDFDRFSEITHLGVSAGASAPESLVEEFLTRLARARPIVVETVETAKEDVVFNIPKRLAS